MCANILCVGGSANIPGLTERLEADLRARVRPEWKVCVRKSSDPIKSTWLGCARFAGNHRDTLQQRAVTREQYQEHGSNWAVRKFALSTWNVRFVELSRDVMLYSQRAKEQHGMSSSEMANHLRRLHIETTALLLISQARASVSEPPVVRTICKEWFITGDVNLFEMKMRYLRSQVWFAASMSR